MLSRPFAMTRRRFSMDAGRAEQISSPLMRLVVLLALLFAGATGATGAAGCSFGGASNPPPDGNPPDGNPDGSPDSPPLRNRRLALRIPAGRVTQPLTDFPVYVRLDSPDLKARLDDAATRLSFVQSNNGVITPLAHEIEQFDRSTGRLSAWVRMSLDSNSETRFELRYGDDAVKAPPDPAGVWRNGHKAVFHLEQEPVNELPTVVNSAVLANPATPTAMESNDLVPGQLGKGLDFDAGTEALDFTNPIIGAGPSTISFWFSDHELIRGLDEAILVLGTAAPSQARWIFNEINLNKLPLGLQDDNWAKPTVTVAGWTLVHWVYKDQQSRLYINGVEIPGSPFTHTAAAATTGTGARIGNVPAGFIGQLGLSGALDEVRISDTDRGAPWIAAELANQKEPAMFVIAGSPEDL